MVISGAERGENNSSKENDVGKLESRQTYGVVMTKYDQRAPQADEHERQVRHDVPEIADAEERACIGKLMIGRILWNR